MATRQRRKPITTDGAAPSTSGPSKSTSRSKSGLGSGEGAIQTPDQLADALASKLTIQSKPKPSTSRTNVRTATTATKSKGEPQTKTPKEQKLAAMRAINEYLQSLSNLVRAGWKKSFQPQGTSSASAWKTSYAEATALVAKCDELLGVLRRLAMKQERNDEDMNVDPPSNKGQELDKDKVDVERAALSIVGKLVAVDMHEAAKEMLKRMHGPLVDALNLSQSNSRQGDLNFLCITLPDEGSLGKLKTLHLTMLSTYLALAITTICHCAKGDELLGALAMVVDPVSPTTGTFLSWLGMFKGLDAKHMDSLLTRVYTALTKFSTSASPSTSASQAFTRPASKSTSKLNPNPTPVPSLQVQHPQPFSTFILRMYALRCLTHTSDGVIEPGMFWDQVGRFVGSFIRNCSQGASSTRTPKQTSSASSTKEQAELEKRATELVLREFDAIVTDAVLPITKDGRVGWLEGDKFLSVCDLWIGVAKKHGDICLLDRIGSLVGRIGSGSGSSSSTVVTPSTSITSTLSTTPSTTSIALTSSIGTQTPTALVSTSSSRSNTTSTSALGANASNHRDFVLEGTKIYATFTQAVVALEQPQPDNADETTRCLEASMQLVQESQALAWLLYGELPSSWKSSGKEAGEFARVSGKVDRAFERLRRGVGQVLEGGSRSSELREIGKQTLRVCVKAMQSILGVVFETETKDNSEVQKSAEEHHKKLAEIIIDILSRALNSLFLLARTTLEVSNPQTYIPAYDFVEEGVIMCDDVQSWIDRHIGGPSMDIDIPNYRRCISGAFYNLAGHLYQGGIYGAAVPFLKKACGEGEKAVDGWKARQALASGDTKMKEVVTKSKGKEKGAENVESKDKDKDKEWTTLIQQLFKRYELLAVCYLKNGDRKNSHESFMKCIQVFPFGDVQLAERSDSSSLKSVLSGEILPGARDKDQEGQKREKDADVAAGLIKQLTNLLDRVTYVGACELLLAPDEVSFKGKGVLSSSTAPTSASSTPTTLKSVPSPTSTSIDSKIVGILLEHQYESLLPYRYKEGARPVLVGLLKDALQVYSVQGDEKRCLFPLRRARVLLKCLEYIYRDTDSGDEAEVGDAGLVRSLGFESVEGIGEEVLKMVDLNSKVIGQDKHLAVYEPQYRISAHLWMALHAHREGRADQLERIVAHVGKAAITLKTLVDSSNHPSSVAKRLSAAGGPGTHHLSSSIRRKTSASPKVVKVTRTGGVAGVVVKKVASPRATRSTRSRVPPTVPAAPRKPTATARTRVTRVATATTGPATARAPAPVGLAAANAGKEKLPVTPKMAKAVLQPTPPRASHNSRGALVTVSSAANPMAFDDFRRFHELLMLTVRILGLLSLVLPRVQLLASLRKLCQRQLGSSNEEFMVCSLELAYEYVQLGKLKRATTIFGTALDIVRAGETSAEISAFYLLRFAEALALAGEVEKSAKVYLEAFEHSNKIEPDHRGMSSVQRIYSRTRKLELSAMAAYVYALIQFAREDVTASLSSMLQSLRLWNRAIDAISRLARSGSKGSNATSSDSNPFQSTTQENAETSSSTSLVDTQTKSKVTPIVRKTSQQTGGEFEWRIFDGLLSSLFALSDTYLARGSPRESEYFLKQAKELADGLNLPVVVGRALTRMSEIQIGLGKLDLAQESLLEATKYLETRTNQGAEDDGMQEVVKEMEGGSDASEEGNGDLIAALEMIENKRLLARFNEKSEMTEHAQALLFVSMKLLEDLNGNFQQFDSQFLGLRKSLDNEGSGDVVVPDLLALVLCRCIWLLRENMDSNFHALVDKLESLPMSTRTKVEENALMANLTLHNVYNRFRNDMFLSSLTESTISIPMGMSSQAGVSIALPIQDVLNALDSAEKYFYEGLKLTLSSGDVLKAREAAISLTLVKVFQTSLGRLGDKNAIYASSLLDASSALTLRREMLEAIHQKFFILGRDDAEWLLMDAIGAPNAGVAKPARTLLVDSDVDMSDSEDEDDEPFIKKYWQSVQRRYELRLLDSTTASTSQTATLPFNWTVIHINLTEDKGTLLVSQQECGSQDSEPLIFCVPLKGRRDNGTGEEEEHLTFEDAMTEFNEIIRLSDEGTKAAIHVRSDDGEARSNWWKQRNELDVRLKDLLENIEFCWLGAFKTILSPRPDVTPELLSELRAGIDRVFQRSLHVKDTKRPTKSRSTGHKRGFSQSLAPSQVSLDDTMLRCFSTLSPKCRDEELEDLLYFVLDLYQLHGVPIAIAEVDALQVVVDLRTVLEEHNARLARHMKANRTTQASQDEHIFLVLDKNLQGLPWESLPIMKERSVSRIPCIDFLIDRVEFADLKHQKAQPTSSSSSSPPPGSATIDPRKGYYILNPSGDLGKTQGRFKEWADDMRQLGWDGIMGRAVSEQQFVDALKTRDLVVYFGHGGGEQYIRSHRIKSLPTCAVTMLWGCSSGALREMGDFDRTGTPYHYMLAGCPTLIANLWDVTDRDIDKFSMSVFEKIGLKASSIRQNDAQRQATSVVAAVAQSRDVCKLKYLTGAAPVVYGIPFYL